MSSGEGRYSASCLTVAFLLGGAVGAGLAILLTPRTGPDVRERIREQANTVRDEAIRVADEVRDRAGEILVQGKDLVDKKKAVLESAFEAGKEAMEREKERLMALKRHKPQEEDVA